MKTLAAASIVALSMLVSGSAFAGDAGSWMLRTIDRDGSSAVQGPLSDDARDQAALFGRAHDRFVADAREIGVDVSRIASTERLRGISAYAAGGDDAGGLGFAKASLAAGRPAPSGSSDWLDEVAGESALSRSLGAIGATLLPPMPATGLSLLPAFPASSETVAAR